MLRSPSVPPYDLNLLIALDVLLAEGSLVGAARRMNLSASAMSRTLGRIREAVGDPILVRAGRTFVPTPRAIALRERVRHAVEEAQSLLRTEAPLDLTTLDCTFTLRANEGFVEVFGAKLVMLVLAAAPGVRIRFAPKSDKDVKPLREGRIDLDIGVLGETGPEVRIQTLFRDRYVGVVAPDHLLTREKVTARRYAECQHVSVSRRGRAKGPIDIELEALGLTRRVVAVVTGFPSALALVRASSLVASVPERQTERGRTGLYVFDLPVRTAPVTISQMWHPRVDADPAHRWLRGCIRRVCGAKG